MMAGMTSAGKARPVADTTSAPEARGDGWAPAPGARNQVRSIIAIPASTPGITPPRNSAPIDTPVTEP